MTEPETITVTVRVEDAYVLVLGPLDYAVRSVMQKSAPPGGSASRVRQALATALEEAGHQWREPADA